MILNYDNLLNDRLTIASKGHKCLLRELNKVLKCYSSFLIYKVSKKEKNSEVLDGIMVRKILSEDLNLEKKRELMKKRCVVYWTTLAPNVEDYSGTAAKIITTRSQRVMVVNRGQSRWEIVTFLIFGLRIRVVIKLNVDFISNRSGLVDFGLVFLASPLVI